MTTRLLVKQAVLLFLALLTLFPAVAVARDGESTDLLKLDKLSNARAEKEPDNYVAGEILVKYKKNKINLENSFGQSKALNFNRAKSLEPSENLQKINISVLNIKDGKTVAEKIVELSNDPNVEYAEPNYVRHYDATTPTDLNFSLLWGADNTGQIVNAVAGTPDADLDLPEAWDIFTGSSSTVIGIMDSGLALRHPDLLQNLWDGTVCHSDQNVTTTCPNHGWNFVADSADPFDDAGHGTHVAGIIGAAGNNARGVVGVNWQVKIAALKVGDADGITVANEIKAIDFAINNNIKILNASFGSAVSSTAEYDAIKRFKDAGGIFIAAAGNDAKDNDSAQHFYPSDYDLDNIISVAATDQNDRLASFSNFGSASVDVGAPGTNIFSTIAEIAAGSENFNSTTPPGIPAGWTATGDWGTFDATSTPAERVGLYADLTHTPYLPNASTTATSPVFDLAGAVGAQLTFDSRCDTEWFSPSTSDYLALEVSADGVSYNRLARWNELILDILEGDFDPNNSPSLVPLIVSLPTSALTSNFHFRFHWVTDGSNIPNDNYAGCSVDNIVLTKITDGADEQYGFKDGTSMAAPQVAGLAGLLWGYKPSATAAQIKNVILTTGDQIPGLATTTVSGRRVNAFNALRSQTSNSGGGGGGGGGGGFSTSSPDTTAPTGTITYSTTSLTNQPVIATLVPSEPVTVANTVSGTLNYIFNDNGSFEFQFVDAAGNAGTATATVSNIDKEPPVITLLGYANTTTLQNSVWADPGATSTDNMSGDLTARITATGTVNTTTPGAYQITYQVEDDAGNSTSTARFVTVAPVAAASSTPSSTRPVANPQTLTLAEDSALAITLTATSTTSTIASFTIVTPPAHGVLMPLNSGATTTYTPAANFAGADSFTFLATDANGATSTPATIALAITPVNDAPTITALGSRIVPENQLLSFTVTGNDVDNDPLQFSVQNLPSGATFNTSTQVFSWTPNFSQSGNYTASFTARDPSGAGATTTAAIVVNNVNRGPSFTSTPVTSATAGQAYSYTFAATDPDNDALTFTLASGAPAWLAINSASRLLSGTPPAAGSFLVTINASDTVSTTPQSFTIAVAAAPSQPSSGGGGGGGGGGSPLPAVIVVPVAQPTPTTTAVTTTIPTSTASTPAPIQPSPAVMTPPFPPQVLGIKISRLDELAAKLKLGKRGPEVLELQTELKKQGFLPKSWKPTGYFGTITQGAIRQYQKKLTAAAPAKPTLAAPAKKSVSSTLSLDKLIRATKPGQRSAKVQQLQQALAKAGFYDTKKWNITGYYGSVTADAVKRYQTRP